MSDFSNDDLLDDDIESNNKYDSSESWIVAYADMITLLFIFFTLILSMSNISSMKLDRLSEGMQKKSTYSLTQIKNDIDKEIDRSEFKDEISTAMTARGLEVLFNESMIFSSAKAEIKVKGNDVLTRFSKILGKISSKYYIAIEGHSDDLPIKSDSYKSNWELSAQRSVNVAHLLISNGVNENNISIGAFAKTRPVEIINWQEDSVATINNKRIKNRRVTLLIYKL